MTDWNVVKAQIGNEHHKALVVVRETLRKLKHLQRPLKNVDVFYYRKFSEVHLRKNELFRDELGHVVFVTPSLEPKQTGCWLPFVAAMDMWLGIGCRLYLLAGPIGRELSSWLRVAERARSHVSGYLKYRPEHAQQVVDKLPAHTGVIPADSPCLEVGMIDDEKAWIPEALVRTFYSKIAEVLSSWFSLEALPPPRIENTRLHKAGNLPRGSEGCSKVVEGGINKNRLKRQQKRINRSKAKAAAKGLEQLSI
ncbi:unnamed protein product [Heligmosomoides polygyrus]|uniref:Uncharacterized protein n=1 Tax=Heligmosomoides polygyrus TaxID=6339 RepID=A0A183G066_HELPZ|nr:unnamed protein product [Heligmosomoides polygyrus]